MRLRLWYVVPGSDGGNDQLVYAGEQDPNTSWYHDWLMGMVNPNPDVIFFYTVDSTDVGEF